jgi:hypothetical protein
LTLVVELHLKISPTDPFTNLPLTKGQIIPNTDLKLQINDFLKKSVTQPPQQKKKEEVTVIDLTEEEDEFSSQRSKKAKVK